MNSYSWNVTKPLKWCWRFTWCTLQPSIINHFHWVWHMCSFSLLQPRHHCYLLVHPALRISLRQGAHVPGKVLVCITHRRKEKNNMMGVRQGGDQSRGDEVGLDITQPHSIWLPPRCLYICASIFTLENRNGRAVIYEKMAPTDI